MSYKRNKRVSQKSHGNSEVLFGPHALIECCRARRRRILSIYTTKPAPKAWRRVEGHIPKQVSVNYVSKDVLARMAGTTDHGGIVASVAPFVFDSSIFDSRKKPKIILLDTIQDVRNVGAILRSAYCLGVDGVVMCKKKGAPLSPVVFKTSAGLAEHLNIYQAPTMKAAVADLKKAGKKPLSVEGKKEGHWVLLDYGHVIIHVFYESVRNFYDLEGLWVDAKRIKTKSLIEAIKKTAS